MRRTGLCSEVNMNSSVMTSIKYDDKVVRYFLLATVLWGLVGMLVGVFIAFELVFWKANLTPWLTFGRLRPLHTNAVIFAFCGNAIFTAIYYSTPRLLKTPMWNKTWSWIHFWGWQLIILLGAITIPLGYTASKEYAELEWPIDILITIVWVIFGINFLMTMLHRREKHIYVAIWFYIATIITVALLHVVNSLAIPVGILKSYSVFAGVQDAFVQWWYGHNAVAFFLTTPFLGLMYYFMPKAAQRPVFSYKLSIIHFWSLVFIYIWAGPHHLHYSAIPNWASTLGMVFSVMLLAPSWGGMINGLFTLRGAWHKVAEDTVLKFFVVGITFYGMSTFEGPVMSIKSVNALSHFTDWTIGHVHSGTLGWNGFMVFGMVYWLVPRLWKTELYSKKLVATHFWLASLGIILYVVSMWVAGITQGTAWKTLEPDGRLSYPDFLQTVVKLLPMYWFRFVGGFMYLTGMVICIFVVLKTALRAPRNIPDTEALVPALPHELEAGGSHALEPFHRRLEGRPVAFTVLTLIAVLVASLFEFVPAFAIRSNITALPSIRPYTPLELEGRDIYIREGCYNCHSQMIRPFMSETLRYGEYSRAGEFVYEHPFLWGSKRTGPDLAREGTDKLKRPDSWHLQHMADPRSTSKGSIMPAYPWLLTNKLDTSKTVDKLRAMRSIGVPYTERDLKSAHLDLQSQAERIGSGLREFESNSRYDDKEIVALIAYLQRLGRDFRVEEVKGPPPQKAE